jgi:hypothetical protein
MPLARAVLDHEGLAELRLELRRHHARDDVGSAGRRGTTTRTGDSDSSGHAARRRTEAATRARCQDVLIMLLPPQEIIAAPSATDRLLVQLLERRVILGRHPVEDLLLHRSRARTRLYHAATPGCASQSRSIRRSSRRSTYGTAAMSASENSRPASQPPPAASISLRSLAWCLERLARELRFQAVQHHVALVFGALLER